MNKFETLYTSFNASVALDDYIYDIIYNDKYTNDEMLDTIVNKAIKLSMIKYIVLSNKESVILKPENSTYTNNLLFSAIESLVDKIAIINDDGTVEVGCHKFDDGNTLVATIRNKFAHGDYYYSDDLNYVIFNFDGDEVPVSLEDLLSFSMSLFGKQNEYKDTSVHTKTYSIIAKSGINRLGNLSISDDTMKKILSSYYEYKFGILSLTGNIPMEAYNLFDEVKPRLEKTGNYYRDSKREVILDKLTKESDDFVDYFEQKSVENNWDTHLIYDICTLSEEQIDSIVDTFRKIKGGIVKSSDVTELITYATRTLNNDYNKQVCIGRCAQLLFCIHIMSFLNDSSIQKACEILSAKTGYNIPVNQDFYSVAQILKLLDICYMFENFDMDYSELPLDSMKPIIFERDEKSLYNLFAQIDRCEKDIGKACIDIRQLESGIEEVKNSDRSDEEKARIMVILTSRLKNAYERREEYIKSHEEKETAAYGIMQDKCDNEKYYYNKELIERIRDSISHGNVYIEPNGEIADAIIKFKDVFKGEVAFELDISLRDLKFTLDECIKTICSDENKIRRK